MTLATRAATPATIGEAIEVPDLSYVAAVADGGEDLVAGRRDLDGEPPKLEKGLMPRPSSGSVEATASRFCAGSAAG